MKNSLVEIDLLKGSLQSVFGELKLAQRHLSDIIYVPNIYKIRYGVEYGIIRVLFKIKILFLEIVVVGTTP